MATRNSTSRVRLTKGRIDSLACPDGKTQAFLWDSDAPGLGVRVTKEGAKSFIHQDRLHGRTVRTTLGAVGKFESIEDARAEARRRADLMRSGTHPKAHEKEQAAAAEVERSAAERAVATLEDAWNAYISVREADWSETTRRDHDKAMKAPGLPRKRGGDRKTKGGPLYPLRGERLEALTAERIRSWMANESKGRPTQTALAFRLLRACLRWASQRPEYAGLADPATVLSGEVRRAVPRLKARDDCLQREQLRPWFDAVKKLPPVPSAYLQALLLTGARREELALLRWQDVDFQWRSITIRDKADGERTIPLTPYVATLLDALPRWNQWVFSGTASKSGRTRSATGRMGPATRFHAKALGDAGLPHVTLHGLRRSFGTLSEWVGCSVGIVAQIMGHKPSAIAEKHYLRRPLGLLRQWHTEIEGWILAEAGITQPAEGSGRLRVVSGGA